MCILTSDSFFRRSGDLLKMVYFQDNYTFAQPGIQNKVKALEELVSRIDGKCIPL